MNKKTLQEILAYLPGLQDTLTSLHTMVNLQMHSMMNMMRRMNIAIIW